MATQYATAAQLRDYIPDNPKVADGTYNTLLDTILQRVTAQIDLLAGRAFGIVTATTKYFDGTGTKTLFGQGGPLDLVSVDANGLQVKLDGTSGTAWTTVPATDFFLQPVGRRSGEPARYLELADAPLGTVSVFTKGLQTVKVIGSWDRGAIPLEVEQMCLTVGARTFRARGAGWGDAIGVSGDAIDQLIITKALPGLDYEVLKHLKHKWVFV